MSPVDWPAQLAIAGAVIVAVLGGIAFVLREMRAMKAMRSMHPPPPPPPRSLAQSFAGDSGSYPDPFSGINNRLDAIDVESRETQAQLHEMGKQLAELAESIRWIRRATDQLETTGRRIGGLPLARSKAPLPKR